MSDPAYLNELGIVCALGSDKDAVVEGLFAADGPRGVAITDALTPGQPLALGIVQDSLPVLDAFDRCWRSRNNALLLAAYEQIRTGAERAIGRYGAARVAVIVGTSTSGIGEAEQAMDARMASGEWPDGFHYAQQEIGAPARFLAMVSGARGPAWTVSTACSSSAKALISAARLLQADLVDAVIAGGADSICEFTIRGFMALGAVSAMPCNPFSRNRCGINIGEGASLFLLTRRHGPVRLAGWGESADAHHMSAPEPQGSGAKHAIRQALERAQISSDRINYVNLHGTATPQNDLMESRAVHSVLGPSVPVSSTKPLTGHALGAAGAIEAGLCWLMMTNNPQWHLPPHWWDGAVDPEVVPLEYVQPGQRMKHAPEYLLSQSFAFGGSNAALLFGMT